MMGDKDCPDRRHMDWNKKAEAVEGGSDGSDSGGLCCW